jgi:hypothetical protein
MSTLTEIPKVEATKTLVSCPQCGRMTDSLKCYRMFRYFLFAYLFYAWQIAGYVGCPSCMRKTIGVRCLVNLFTANLIFPVVLVQLAGAFLFTFMRGHSREVRRALEAAQSN